MPFAEMQVSSAIAELRARIATARGQLPQAVSQILQQAAATTRDALHDAAPVGKTDEGQSAGLPGDAPGRLAASFVVRPVNDLQVDIVCVQPLKLKIIVEGRKEVLPKVKMALMWPGLAHPVRRAGPTKANDFVTPVLATVPDQAVAQATATFLQTLLGS